MKPHERALRELEQHQRFWGQLAKMECKQIERN